MKQSNTYTWVYCIICAVLMFNLTISQELNISECFQQKEYIHFGIKQNFSDAQALCEANDASLVQITSSEENNFIHNFSTSITDENFLIGLKRVDENSNPNLTESYLFLDGTPIDANFGSKRSVFPWKEDRPKENENSDCVFVRRNADLLWDNFICSSIEDFVSVCERRCSDLIQQNRLNEEIIKLKDIFLYGAIGSGIITILTLLISVFKRREYNRYVKDNLLILS